MAYNPSAFDQGKKRKQQQALIRQAAAAEMASKTSPLDVIAELAPYAGAAIGGFASGGNPQAVKAGYEGGKAIGGMISPDKEAKYQQVMEETAAETGEVVPMTKKKETEDKTGDMLEGAMSKIKKMKDADAPVSGYGITPDEMADQAAAGGFNAQDILSLLKYAGS
jgi:hypothetical protein